MKIPLEEWRPIPNCDGYEVSNLGRVRTYRSINGRGPLKDAPRLMTLNTLKGKPYLRVRLPSIGGGFKDIKVHILVLTTFVGPRPSKAHDGCHRDGDARDNSLSNLRWGTKQDNADDRISHGTQVRGAQVNLAQLTEAQVREIKAESVWVRGTATHFAQKFGVYASTIMDVHLGRTWRHIC